MVRCQIALVFIHVWCCRCVTLQAPTLVLVSLVVVSCDSVCHRDGTGPVGVRSSEAGLTGLGLVKTYHGRTGSVFAPKNSVLQVCSC